MALRIVQIYVPEDSGVDLDALMEGHDIIGTWRDTSIANRILIQLLVSAEDAEEIMDRFEQVFTGDPTFRVVLFPVEAVLPRPKPVDPPVLPQTDKSEPKNNGLPRISREELYTDISETVGINLVFFAMTFLSTIVAAVGLLRNDTAIIIGAMVIAPLLGPNVAMSLGVTLGDFSLLRRAAITNLSGVGVALLFSILIGLFFRVDPTIPAIASRSQLNISDLALALAAGSAGTLAFSRGISGAVIGVTVAVALMPPLVTLGLMIGSGQLALALGAFLLLAANVICINLAGVATFLAQGVRPRTWWEEERARQSARTAIIIWCALLLVLAVILILTHVDGLRVL